MSNSPTLVTLGRLVKFCRETAGIKQAELAKMLGYSNGWLSNVETGQLRARRDQIVKIEKTLGLPESSFTDVYDSLRHEHPVESFDRYAELERQAITIQGYDSQAMPGLLQTEETARALISAGRPTAKAEVIEDLVARRLDRQQILDKDESSALWLVVDEPVIRRPVGGRDVHAAQLDHLLKEMERPAVTVQVVPFATGAHAGLAGTFYILSFESEPNIAYTEDPATGHILERPDLVRAITDTHHALRMSVLPTKASADLIKQVREET